MILDRLYNDHTRRIIITVSTNIIHLVESVNENLTICGTNKNQDSPCGKNIKYVALDVSLRNTGSKTLNKRAHNYVYIINRMEMSSIGVN